MKHKTIEKLDQYPLWTALITPFNQDLSVDMESLKKLLSLQEIAGNGILILGSTGENLSLSEQEKRDILDLALDMNLKVPLMVGVGGINQENTLGWLTYLESRQGIDCYLMVTPLYTKPGKEGQTQWFKGLLDISTRPSMLYNIPGRTGCALNPGAVETLKDHPNFWAIKEASGKVDDFENYRRIAPNISVYSGDDGMVPHFALSGCKGCVSVASNIWPNETQEYVKKAISFDHKGIWPTWGEACNSLFTTSNPIPVKALIHEVGLIKTPFTRPPLSHLDLSEKGKAQLIEANKMVKQWSK